MWQVAGEFDGEGGRDKVGCPGLWITPHDSKLGGDGGVISGCQTDMVVIMRRSQAEFWVGEQRLVGWKSLYCGEVGILQRTGYYIS